MSIGLSKLICCVHESLNAFIEDFEVGGHDHPLL